jgi:ABC-type transport system involved in multi-copper enzyme maturation permease subunit
MKRLRAIWAIALNTFREAVRNKVLATLLFFAVILPVSAVVLGQMSMHEEQRVTIDVSLFLSTLFAVIIAIYSSVTLLHTELEQRTIYTLLSKPIARWQFLVGKYFGVMALMFAVVVIMATLSGVMLAVQDFRVEPELIVAFGTVYLQTALVTALSLMFASFSTPLLSGMYTASVFIVGNLLSLTEELEAVFHDAFGTSARWVIHAIWVVVPNFEQLNLTEFATHSQRVPLEYIASAVLYTMTYASILLIIATLAFNRRDFA